MSQIISVLFTTCVACLRCDAAFVVLKDSDEVPVSYGDVDEGLIRQVQQFVRSQDVNGSLELRDSREYREVMACPLRIGENELGALVLLSREQGRLSARRKEIGEYLSLFQKASHELMHRWEAYTASCSIPDWRSVLYLDREMIGCFRKARYEVFSWARFAGCVGGDFYDFYQADDETAELVIADVAGKGIEAGFPMGEMKDSLRILWSLNLSENEFAREANKMLYESFEKKSFATLLHMKFNFTGYRFEYLRAGHSPILHYNSLTGVAEYFTDEGSGLGMVGEDKYEGLIRVYEKSFNRGDIFLLYTDGVVDAKRAGTGEHYGYDRLQQLVNNNAGIGPEQMGKALIEELSGFCAAENPSDDQSFIIIKA